MVSKVLATFWIGAYMVTDYRRRTCVRVAAWVCVILAMITATPSAWGDIDRPEKDKGPTRVRVMMFVLDMDDVNGAEQHFTVNVFYEARWRDPRLAHRSPKAISRPLNEVWHPRLQFINQQRIWSTFPNIVEVAPNGEVLYRQRIWGHFSQPLKLEDFPFDHQTFNIQLVAARYGLDEVELVLDPDHECGIAKDFSVADWEITEWRAGPLDYKSVPSSRQPVGFWLAIEARREADYFVLKLIIPLVLIVIMSWTVFWIDPKQGGTQISVAMTTMLTLIAFRFSMGVSLPNIPYLTRMDFFILVSTILVFASLIEVIATSGLARAGRLKCARSLDRWSRLLFPGVFILLTLKAFVF